ncbi:LacI family DNA-binding transcriptional regulator [Acidisoma cladoniae]|jgi:LacI family transcriptional regulator|uniref:LacI family DNA-binding transcriptional regulator n=1 Tax=Acidisoma cladoniae TaxID=3040935 RepID=UPI00254F0E99|nr:LacI family DNA-binding transcriptional regulator [Acidisoma sp. PAMC 29798]
MAKLSTVARLRDVAAAASVSVATVSRYVNGTLVLPTETAQRIDAAIKQLDYRANPHARRLSMGRSDTIGLLVPDIANPFFAQLADAVERAAAARGLDLMLCATHNQPQRELDYIAWMRRNHMDGVLFATNHVDDGTLARAIAGSADVVLIDEDVPGTDVAKVFADNDLGGYLAGRYLVAAGHRRFAFIGGQNGMLSTTERLAGFRRAVSEGGPDCGIICEAFTRYVASDGRAAIERMLALPTRPTAIFATSDELTIGVLEALQAQGIRVPQDISLISFDDVRPLHLFSPPVTAIRQPLAEMGQLAFDLLVDSALRGTTNSPRRLTVELIERASVAPPAAQ